MEKNEIIKDCESNNLLNEELSFSDLMRDFEKIRLESNAQAESEYSPSNLRHELIENFNDLLKKIPKDKFNPARIARSPFKVVEDNEFERVIEYTNTGMRKSFTKKRRLSNAYIENYILKELAKGKDFKDIKNPYGEDSEQSENDPTIWVSPLVLVNVMRVIAASNFVKNYQEKNKFFVNERIRDGYIGKEKVVNGYKMLQTERGFPWGTVVAIPHGKDVVIGVSLVDSVDKTKQRPILGLAMALNNALKTKDSMKELDEIDNLNNYPQFDYLTVPNKYIPQLKHFIRRARAFYFPDDYSYSRGKVRPSESDVALWKKNKKNRDAVLASRKEE